MTEAIAKLRCRRAPGDDQVPAELLKATCAWSAPVLQTIYNDVFERHLPVQLGHGILVPLQKPGKPLGPCKSLRPVTLLSCTRKVLSLVVVSRAKPRFEARLPPGQAGARSARSTADGVWAKRMMIAVVMHFNIDIHWLGTDISQAFDSVERNTLLLFFERDGWMAEDELRVTRFLLANTTLQIRVGAALSASFRSDVGTLQGDALSMLIFIGYLAGAMQNVKIAISDSVPSLDRSLCIPAETSYVDDVDHHSTSQAHLETVLACTDVEFPKWNFKLNIGKTERGKLFVAPSASACVRCGRICRSQATCCDHCSTWWHNSCAGITQAQFQQFVVDPAAEWTCQLCVTGQAPTLRGQEQWRTTRHLGTLLDTASDVAKRITCANAAYATLTKVWLRRNLVNEERRIQLFKAFVLPHFMYNLCTQALTKPLEQRFDVAHRKLLRRLIGMAYPNRITNEALYRRTSSTPISVAARSARWRYFGHILRRRMEQHPAAQATFAFFEAQKRLTSRVNHPRNSLLDILRVDLKESEHLHGLELQDSRDLDVLCDIADEREQWRELMGKICGE